jgi:CRP/FNR family cyclic AMP-dependent transcriptional regulator
MIGITRSRVSFFMNRFRKLGFIDYDGGSSLQVHSSLLDIVLHGQLSRRNPKTQINKVATSPIEDAVRH